MSLKTVTSTTALIALGCLSAQGLQLKKINDSIIDARALCFTQGTWGLCVNGQTFQQDALATFGGCQ